MLWDAELLRVSAFPPSSIAALAPRFSLGSLLGKPAEEITERPQGGFRHELASFEDAHIFLTQQPGRVDLFLGTVPKQTVEVGLVSIGPYDKVKTSFLDVAKKLIADFGEANRLAYGSYQSTLECDHH
jgi:hypothetical protein